MGATAPAWAAPLLSQEVLQGCIVSKTSASSRFSRVFSSFQPLQPLGLRDVRSAEFGFPLVNAGVTPCLRHRSATATPASCSFKIPMICSSVKRLRLMLWSLSWPERTLNWIGSKEQGQRRYPPDVSAARNASNSAPSACSQVCGTMPYACASRTVSSRELAGRFALVGYWAVLTGTM
jgi:hypothetical protein